MDPDRQADIAALDSTLTTVERVLDVEGLRGRIEKLEHEASDPNLWDDQARAQKVTSDLSHTQGELRRVEELRQRLDEPTLWDAFLDVLRQRGLAAGSDEEIAESLRTIAHNREQYADLWAVSEALLQHDAARRALLVFQPSWWRKLARGDVSISKGLLTVRKGIESQTRRLRLRSRASVQPEVYRRWRYLRQHAQSMFTCR